MSTPLASHLRARGAVVGVNGAIYRLDIYGGADGFGVMETAC